MVGLRVHAGGPAKDDIPPHLEGLSGAGSICFFSNSGAQDLEFIDKGFDF
jgi:hypothetical protein